MRIVSTYIGYEDITLEEVDALVKWMRGYSSSRQPEAKQVKRIKSLQDKLVRLGILRPAKTRVLYRGMHGISDAIMASILQGKQLTFKRKSIQSWTPAKKIALSFSIGGGNGIVLKKIIPAEHIIFTVTKKFVEWANSVSYYPYNNLKIGDTVDMYKDQKEHIVRGDRMRFTLQDIKYMDIGNDKLLVDHKVLHPREVPEHGDVLLERRRDGFHVVPLLEHLS